MLRRVIIIALSLLFCPAASAQHTDEECLSSAVFYEAGGEPLEGQRAVMQVVLNRARKFRKTICEIVTADKQFSWYPEKPIREYDEQMQKFMNRVKRAQVLISEKSYLWFFRKDLNPKWAQNMFCIQIQSHLFCREVT